MKSLTPKNARTTRGFRPVVLVVFTLLVLSLVATGAFTAAPMSGAIFTTDGTCTGTNVNIFTTKDAVYLDGGPAHEGAAGLPDGYYYVQVTEPGNTLLGTSVGSGNPQPVHVTNGAFDECYQLSAILITASDSSPGYDTTTNGGDEYKVWVSKNSSFLPSESKTDNFKVKPAVVVDGTLNVNKFYDANADGVNNDGQLITGWKVRIQAGDEIVRFTPASVILNPEDYIVTEADPTETNWVHTTINPVNVTINAGDNKTVAFGNLCLGAGGGHTLGFWSNKNGQATMNDGSTLVPELNLLDGKCLRNGSGTDTNFAGNYTNFRNWLLSANATNMSYMLSAQLAAMELSVEAGFVQSGALIYAPGTNSANGLGFATVGAVVAEAETELCAHATALSGDVRRSYQEALKNALDNANNNMSFVQSTPCPFSF